MLRKIKQTQNEAGRILDYMSDVDRSFTEARWHNSVSLWPLLKWARYRLSGWMGQELEVELVERGLFYLASSATQAVALYFYNVADWCKW